MRSEELAAAEPRWPIAASAPLTPLILNNGTRVGVRQIQSGDSKPLAQFLGGLAPDSYSACFADKPSAQHIAATFCAGNLAYRKSFVALDDKGAIVGLVDYSGTISTACVVGIVVADELRGAGLGPRLLQEAMTAAKLDGYDVMVGYRQRPGDSAKARKVTLDLNKPLRGQHTHIPPQTNDPFWPPEAWA